MAPRTAATSVPKSAGILLFRHRPLLEVLLVHPGGPFWRTQWQGWWQIPKGLVQSDEAPLAAARREFREETGFAADGPTHPLGEVRQRGGKRVVAFACEGDIDETVIAGNTFEMEWPPHSGRFSAFPEIDAARWFAPADAKDAMLPSQRPFLDRLLAMLSESC